MGLWGLFAGALASPGELDRALGSPPGGTCWKGTAPIHSAQVSFPCLFSPPDSKPAVRQALCQTLTCRDQQGHHLCPGAHSSGTMGEDADMGRSGWTRPLSHRRGRVVTLTQAQAGCSEAEFPGQPGGGVFRQREHPHEMAGQEKVGPFSECLLAGST